MSDIGLSKIDASESGIETAYCGRSLFSPRREIRLTIAQERERTGPWSFAMSFDDRKVWFDFVRLVNKCNRELKKAPKDEEGFPIFDHAQLDEWRERYKEES
jgi:hypothetical protein